jgi:hypothetical protein
MRLSKEALSVRVVVRRTKRGATPFVWEINRDSMAEPVYVSPDAFDSMESAYTAGQARLAEFIPARGSMRESQLWEDCGNGLVGEDPGVLHGNTRAAGSP